MSSFESRHDHRLARARLSLAGLSVGDALGQQFFEPHVLKGLPTRTTPPGPWFWTDDTAMALSIVNTLAAHEELEPGLLASAFARTWKAQPGRGYGPGAAIILQGIANGHPWAEVAGDAFGGEGSMGNGAAMRIAPLGAFFADDLDHLLEAADRASAVTHAHPEGRAGGIAVALAAALASNGEPGGEALLQAVVDRLPDSAVKNGLVEATGIAADTPSQDVARALGAGDRILAQDTVPFALWCAAHHLGDVEETFWATVAGLGDRDTTCAIACGVSVLAGDIDDIPLAWRQSREALPV